MTFLSLLSLLISISDEPILEFLDPNDADTDYNNFVRLQLLYLKYRLSLTPILIETIVIHRTGSLCLSLIETNLP